MDCPSLWALACAWMSLWGFQSESKMITVSAVARLIPRPPAFVDSRKTECFPPSFWLKASTASCLSLPFTLPSRMSELIPLISSHSWTMSSTSTNCE